MTHKSDSSSDSDSSDSHTKHGCKLKSRHEERKGELKERREKRKKEAEERKDKWKQDVEDRKKAREEKREDKKLHKDHKAGHSDTGFAHSAGVGLASAHHDRMTQGEQTHFRGSDNVGGYYPEHTQQYGGDQAGFHQPPPYVPQQPPPPPSGYRVPLTTQAMFPLDPNQTGPPAFVDADGISPIFVGSALMDNSVHPCKIGPHLNPFASVPYGGGEHAHQGRFDLLPFRPDQMEWVRTSGGMIPPGRRPIEGGYEEDGNKLYHAVGVVSGVRIPGKTGEHLCVPFHLLSCGLLMKKILYKWWSPSPLWRHRTRNI